MEKFVQVGPINVAYAVEGSGPAVLVIHGTGGSYEGTWGNLGKALAPDFTVITPNYSGSGKTQDDRERLELDDLVEQNVQAVMQEGFTHFHVVGYSLGAVVATAIAAKYPERVQSVTAIAGWVESDLAVAYQFDLWQKLFRQDRELFAQFAIHTGLSPAFYSSFQTLEQLHEFTANLAATLAEGTGKQAELDTRINLRPLLGKVTAPALAIGLTYDRMVPVEQTREMAALLPDARYHEIASGHLVLWEQEAELIETVLSFVRSTR
ncbi:alpha/beta hydrolase [Brevibacillus sp. 1238]|uniref:alpha/beta fold hydrolase n=1 Tax=Brevibacillus sp. 1238 TaxID=2940565 RepID=UPI002474F432|nr:alpha/beta hydrolase [Brevibacillus sp. 1238]MDH6352540.1 3-oxoadipate enol-lactonase [Brevibacillus sp. 1238]